MKSLVLHTQIVQHCPEASLHSWWIRSCHIPKHSSEPRASIEDRIEDRFYTSLSHYARYERVTQRSDWFRDASSGQQSSGERGDYLYCPGIDFFCIKNGKNSTSTKADSNQQPVVYNMPESCRRTTGNLLTLNYLLEDKFRALLLSIRKRHIVFRNRVEPSLFTKFAPHLGLLCLHLMCEDALPLQTMKTGGEKRTIEKKAIMFVDVRACFSVFGLVYCCLCR